jgi:hypothetical protein
VVISYTSVIAKTPSEKVENTDTVHGSSLFSGFSAKGESDPQISDSAMNRIHISRPLNSVRGRRNHIMRNLVPYHSQYRKNQQPSNIP